MIPSDIQMGQGQLCLSPTDPTLQPLERVGKEDLLLTCWLSQMKLSKQIMQIKSEFSKKQNFKYRQLLNIELTNTCFPFGSNIVRYFRSPTP